MGTRSKFRSRTGSLTISRYNLHQINDSINVFENDTSLRRDRRVAKKRIRLEVRRIIKQLSPNKWTDLHIALVKRYSGLLPMNPVLWDLFSPASTIPDDTVTKAYHLA